MVRSSSVPPGQDSPLIFRLRTSLLLLWASALAYLSLASEVKAHSGLFGWDKINHFGAYAVLALLLLRVMTVRRPVSAALLLVAWIACTAYGALLEFLQWAMAAGRQWEAGDLLANALGSLAACVIFRHIFLPSSTVTDDR